MIDEANLTKGQLRKLDAVCWGMGAFSPVMIRALGPGALGHWSSRSSLSR